MDILQRPHPAIEGLTELVLATDEGKEIRLLTVSDFCRNQAKQMRQDLVLNGYRYVARYVNNAGPRDLMQFLDLIDPGSNPRKTMKLEFLKDYWQFWGDLPSKQMGFCFMLFDESLVYRIMARLGFSEENQLREFMRRRKFKAEPKVQESRVFFRAAAEEKVTLPAIFQPDGDGGWRIPKLGVLLSIKDGIIEIMRPLFPGQDSSRQIGAATTNATVGVAR